MKCTQCSRDCLEAHRAVQYNGLEFCCKWCVGVYIKIAWPLFSKDSHVEWPRDGIKELWSDHCWVKVY